MELNIAGIVDDSIVDGDGCRLTVFVQGCHRRCHGCQNPETQPLEGGHEETLEALLQKIRQNPLLTGVTFSGGEPFLQCAPLAKLAKEIHAMGLDIWSYSGYTLEELRARHDEATDALLAECKKRMPAYMVPAHIDVRSGPLPRNPNGKIDRKTLATSGK